MLYQFSSRLTKILPRYKKSLLGEAPTSFVTFSVRPSICPPVHHATYLRNTELMTTKKHEYLKLSDNIVLYLSV